MHGLRRNGAEKRLKPGDVQAVPLDGCDTYDLLGGMTMDSTVAARFIELEAEVASLRKQLELALAEIENFRKRAIGITPTPEPSFREIKTNISPAVVGFARDG